MTISAQQAHRALGLLMLVPLLLWAVTGAVFLTKPGYDAAYEQIAPVLYPFDRPVTLDKTSRWSQMRLLRTVLGYHLLVHEAGSWQHLDPFTLAPKPSPSRDQIAALVNDAISGREARYGSITGIEELSVITDTGVVITLDWNTLSLAQSGADTRFISTLYRIHYLQWFGPKTMDKLFGVVGLSVLAALSLLGLLVYLKGRQQ